LDGEGQARRLINGVKVLADVAVLPGSSLMIDGDVTGGLLHSAGAVIAAGLFGPIGWAAVIASALSKSIAGRGLLEPMPPQPAKPLGQRFSAANAAFKPKPFVPPPA
jgi:hypothetical protein